MRKDQRLNVRLGSEEYRAIELAAARWGPDTQSNLGRAILRDWVAAQDAGPAPAPALSAEQAQAIIDGLQRLETKLDQLLQKQ